MQRSLAALITTTLITWLSLKSAKADFLRPHCAYIPDGYRQPTVFMAK